MLGWDDAPTPNPGDAVYYVLYWSQDSTFAQGVDSVTTESPSYCFDDGGLSLLRQPGPNTLDDPLPDDITIYWKVRAVNWLNLTAWCTPETGWHFVVYYRQPPNAFHLLSPANHAVLGGLETDLQWEAATDPDPGDSVAYYRIHVAEDSLFTQPMDYYATIASFHLTGLQYSQTYWWKVLAFDTRDMVTVSSEIWSFSAASNVPTGQEAIPREFALEQNYPNPFNPSTTIRVAVPRPSRISLEVFDVLGRKVATVADREFDAGYHALSWNCRSCADGIYFLQMRAEGFVQTRKMLVVK
jgi:hypothetical protein